MIWILLTLLISAINLYVGHKVNPKLNVGFRIFNPKDKEDVIFAVSFSLIPILNILMLIRIISLIISNIYFNNYDN